MVTGVHYARTQWASGQGFFHSGTVQLGDRSAIYVFDCGSLNPPSLDREIATFRARHGDTIDLLFLSHFHDDHVNGVPALLDGATVRSIVIPLVPAWERLYVFAQAVASGADITDWYRELISSPDAAIRRISDAEIIVVNPEEHTDEDPVEAPDSPQDEEGPDELPEGRGQGSYVSDVDLSPGVRSVLSGADNGARVPVWEWSCLCTAFAVTRRPAFLSALATALNKTDAALEQQISTPAGIEDLVRNHAGELVAAYAATFPDLNLTSLIVYSGPATEMQFRGTTFRTRSITERGEVHAWDVRSGWLGTGDQSMGVRRCAETVTHFGSRLSRVGTLALPHHASRHSFHPSLLAVFGDYQPVCSASVGTNNTYGHPHREVILDVSSNGNHMVVVTEQEPSRWTEAGVCYL
ncbi:MAG: MBL fold metallo-hydrolase [Cellulomonadaceae bacterium]